MGKDSRQVGARQPVDQCRYSDANQTPTRCSPRQLEHGDDCQPAKHEVERRRRADAAHQFLVGPHQVCTSGRENHDQRRINGARQPRHVTARAFLGSGANAHSEKPERGHQRQVNRSLDQGGERREAGGVQMEARCPEGNGGDDVAAHGRHTIPSRGSMPLAVIDSPGARRLASAFTRHGLAKPHSHGSSRFCPFGFFDSILSLDSRDSIVCAPIHC